MTNPTWFKTKEQLEQERLEREQSVIASQFTYKTDIWERCTEEEAEILDASLDQAPAKQRRLWADSITIEHGSEYYPTLREIMLGEFGESRTNEILAPSKEN